MAVKYGIDNTPDAESKDHIIESIENLLDPLQEASMRIERYRT